LYAQLHELETFARFGAELEPETRLRYERGRRLREALKQPRSHPLRTAHEVAVLFAVGQGCLDDVPVDQVVPLLEALLRRLDAVDAEVLDAIEREDDVGTESATRLRRAIEWVRRDHAGGSPS
jgi:F-type H+-transporting ATPase subunit alpha